MMPFLDVMEKLSGFKEGTIMKIIFFAFWGIIIVLYFAKIYYIVKIVKLRKEGDYPCKKEKLSLKDVIKLIEIDEMVLAIDLYRKLEKVSLYEAKKKVGLLKSTEEQKREIAANSKDKK
jgi:hypothetical protein